MTLGENKDLSMNTAMFHPLFNGDLHASIFAYSKPHLHLNSDVELMSKAVNTINNS